VRGETREIAQAAHRIPFTSWDLSPDGSKVAVVHNDDDTITIVQLESGQERVVRVDGWRYFEFVSWSADGNGFFATGSTAIGTGYPALLRVDADGRVHVLRQHPNEWHVRLHASPDGQSLAFAKVSFHGNAWMIEGFR
jgi:Tol biopolymer transport system component